ncbi:MAG: ABC transporter permease subunit, partial [Turicibacter sp.]|nr:ABC transporter permease subunit [Turicibacter sp.]
MGSSTRRYLTSTALMFALWQLGAMKLGREILLPAPLAVLRRAWQIAGAPIFLSTVVITLLRFLIGFLIAFLLAFMLGVLSGRYLMVYEYLAPFVQLVRAVPTVSIILLVLIWLRSQLAPILVGGLMAFPILYFNVVEGIRSVDGKLLEMAKVFCLSPGRVFSRIYLPSLTNYVMAGLA